MPITSSRAQEILVVDDDPIVCESLRRMLAFDGHRVEIASSGKAALSLFANGRFDLVIVDFAMPAMRGDELAAAIKLAAPLQPVLMITAHSEALKWSGIQFTSVDFVVSKPLRLEDLRKVVGRILSTGGDMFAPSAGAEDNLE
jgi:CheY-like chemotaxis protein